jgi:hypothetical protein
MEGLVIFAQWAHLYNFSFDELRLAHVSSRLLRLISPWYRDEYEDWLIEQEIRRFYEAWCDVLDYVEEDVIFGDSMPFDRLIKFFINRDCSSCFMAQAKLERWQMDSWDRYTDPLFMGIKIFEDFRETPCTCKIDYSRFGYWVVSYAEQQGFKWWWDGYYLQINYEPDNEGYDLDEVEEFILSPVGRQMIETSIQ